MRKQILFGFITLLVAFVAQATDYYVSTTGSDEADGLSADTPFATIDKAITMATAATDVIHVAAGAYTTTTQWGPSLKAKLIGEGATRDAVTISPASTHRTLRVAANAWLENVTVIGESTGAVDKGGAIEMMGGTVTNCVIRGGRANNSSNTEGGNIFISNGLLVDCEILNGSAVRRGGNLYVDGGTVRSCIITNGVSDNVGGNIYQYVGTIEGCTIADGTSVNDGGNVRMNGGGVLQDSRIRDGVITSANSEKKKGANVYMDSTAKLSRCHLIGGSHQNAYNGGSLSINSSSVRVEDCLIEGSLCGGALLNGTSYLYNTTIVKNEQYGVWAWSAAQHLFNCIVYGNTPDGASSEWSGDMPNATGAEFLNCATVSGGRFTTTAYPTLVIIDPTDFADYAAGDYRPAQTSRLIDAGTPDPRGLAASASDLDGHLRLCSTVDIGCYEYQKEDLIVKLDGLSLNQIFAPAVVTFTNSVLNSRAPETITYTYDFGDDSTNETGSAATMTHTYAEPGIYTVTITAHNTAIDESATMEYVGYVRVASSTVYVKAGNPSAAFPYDTPSTAYANLKTAVNEAVDGYTLYIEPGVYESTDQTSVSKALALIGTGATPEDVILRNTVTTPDTYYHRTLELNNAGAKVMNVTIENGCVKNQYGGNLRLAAGSMASNCVIRGGLVVADGENGAGGAVVLGGTGSILTHCVLTNNTTQGTSSSGNYAGGAVFVEYNSQSGRISNCLIAGNRYVSTDANKAGTAGIRFGGSNDRTAVENCTIVGNTVEGALPEADHSAGIYCTSWHCYVRNNIIVGNVETNRPGVKSAVKLDTNGGSNYSYKNNITDDALIAGSGTKSVDNQLVTNWQKLFRNFATGDLVPQTSGAAYNHGTTNSIALLPSVDLLGQPRIYDTSSRNRIDIGCFESQRRSGFALILR